MARPVYSTAFIDQVLFPGSESWETIVTDDVVVVRDVSGTIQAGTAGNLELSITVNDIELAHWDVPAGAYVNYHWEGRRVAPGPTTLVAACTGGTGFVVSVAVSGYLLTP
jgi:hypothetical protein